MRSTPAVSLACRDGGAWRALVIVLHGLAAAAVLAWLVGPAWALLSLPAVLLLLRVRRPAGPAAPVLAWDGQAWLLDGVPGHPTLVLDLGMWLLLRFDAEGGSRLWLPVSPAAGGWSAWRAALVASAGPPAAPGATASRAA